jgi:hypothetical protein
MQVGGWNSEAMVLTESLAIAFLPPMQTFLLKRDTSPAAITFGVSINSRNYILGIAIYLQRSEL